MRMRLAFLAPALAPVAAPFPRSRRACPRSRPAACIPDPPRRRRRVRVPRRHTASSPGWEWRGGRARGWAGLFGVDAAVRKAWDALLGRGASESPLLARVTALGFAVLKSVSDALERTLYPDTEKELVVEYGLAEPSPKDKVYVDPLREWETSPVTYYRDSFGRRVYLQLEGANGLVVAADYRDLYDDGEGHEEGDGEAEARDVAGREHPTFRALAAEDILDGPDEPPYYMVFPEGNDP